MCMPWNEEHRKAVCGKIAGTVDEGGSRKAVPYATFFVTTFFVSSDATQAGWPLQSIGPPAGSIDFIGSAHGHVSSLTAQRRKPSNFT